LKSKLLYSAILLTIIEFKKLSSTSSPTSKTEYPSRLILASWTDRFIAWLIDFVIISIALGVIFAAVSFPFWFDTDMQGAYKSLEPFHYIITSLVFFVYWTYFESTTGQSIGKKILHIKTTDLISGQTANPKAAAIETFGKAFLLPLDLILGWIFTNDKRQRIFNRASDTILIKLRQDSVLSQTI
jgi:uncharacterized RDD family membrane protein YckC